MKKIFATIAIFAAAFAPMSASAQSVETGTMLVDAYYGYPNVGKSFWSAFETESSFDTKAIGMGPMGIRFEYMIADNLGFGADINYVSSGFSFSDTVSVYNSATSTWSTNTYDYQYRRDKFRVMARLNYHFVVTDVVDAYTGFGAGYKHKINKFTTTDPNAEEVSLDGLGLLPVSIRLCLGTRFFFTDFLGANIELGLGGGPLMSGGLTVKF